MEIGRHWKTIQDLFEKAFKTSLYYSIATVDEDGSPRVSPIGGLMLNDDRTGCFIEAHAGNLLKNLRRNPTFCIMAVNSTPKFWLKSIVAGRFTSPPGVRLMGTVIRRREATKDDIDKFLGRVKSLRCYFKLIPLRKLKGYRLLWGNVKYVWEFELTSAEPLKLGTMGSALWKD